jgi:hypothetical protein
LPSNTRGLIALGGSDAAGEIVGKVVLPIIGLGAHVGKLQQCSGPKHIARRQSEQPAVCSIRLRPDLFALAISSGS